MSADWSRAGSRKAYPSDRCTELCAADDGSATCLGTDAHSNGSPLQCDILAPFVELRRLGNSGLKVSAIGLGGNTFGATVDGDDAVKTIRGALDLGVTFID